MTNTDQDEAKLRTDTSVPTRKIAWLSGGFLIRDYGFLHRRDKYFSALNSTASVVKN